MRITEHRMIELASESLSSSRSRVARAGEQLNTGERVSLPSQDPTAWAAGRRAEAARAMNEGRGEALARAQERMTQVEGALSQIGSALSRAQELAVMASSETIDEESLDAIAIELSGLRQSALAAANSRASDGEYLLAGSQTDQPAFDANGVYQGDGLSRQMETQNGVEQRVTITGEVLTATSGVDVFAELAALEAAVQTNDRDGIAAAIDAMRAAHRQVSTARADGGAQSASLMAAEATQQELDGSLVALHSRLVGADPITAASELAQHSQALEAAQIVAARIVELTRP